MIEIYHDDGRLETREQMTFEEMQQTVGGFVECVHFREGNEVVQLICNEDGRQLGLRPNIWIDPRLRGKVNIGPGSVGTCIILSGDDLLK